MLRLYDSHAMLYTGVDIIEIARVEQAVARWGERFLSRVFTADERAESANRIPSLAARFAAKEAAAKALGVGVRGFGASVTVGTHTAVHWRDLEVRRAAGGRPEMILHGAAAVRAAALGWQSIAVSLSHSREYAVAFVVAQGGQVNES